MHSCSLPKCALTMDWKKIQNLIVRIIGVFLTIYYGFCHYVLNDKHQEWEDCNGGKKGGFYDNFTDMTYLEYTHY